MKKRLMDFPIRLKYPNSFAIVSYDKFENVQSFTGITVSATNVSVNAVLELYYRHSIDGKQFSEFKPLDSLTVLDINSLLVNDCITLDVMFKRTGNNISSTIIVNNFEFQIDYKSVPLDKCKYNCYNYDKRTNDMATSIFKTCPTTFDIYDVGNYVSYNQEMNNVVSNMYGQCVTYFKTAADMNTRDVILKEYSLYNVVATKELNIVLPDNNIPSNETRFTSFDLDFFEMPYEVHIAIKEFEDKFKEYCNDGVNIRPEKEDYLYFPLTNRLYQVEGAFLFKEFMQQPSYYKVALVKYQNKKMINVPSDFQIDPSQILSTESNFGNERIEELEDVVKPQEYTLDRKLVLSRDRNLKVISEDVSLNYSIFSKYHYDLSGYSTRTKVVDYSLKGSANESISVLFWFKFKKTAYRRNTINSITSNGINTTISFLNVHNFSINDSFTFDNIAFSENIFYVSSVIDAQTITIIDIATNYTYSSSDVKTITYMASTSFLSSYSNMEGIEIIANRTSIDTKINGISYTLALPNQMKTDIWYAYIFNASTPLEQWDATIYELPYAYRNGTLTQVKMIVDTLNNPISFNSDVNYEINSQSDLKVSNIRILDRIVERNVHTAILTQYVMQDSRHIVLSDNCEPKSNLPYYVISK